MRAVIQRVDRANVSIEGRIKGEIDEGLLLFLGVCGEDSEADIDWLVNKVAGLRVFEDAQDVMNISLRDAGGGVLVISQFTLYGSLVKGSRPSFNRAAKPEIAIPLYELFIDKLSGALGKPIPSGEFGAMMEVDSLNHGPLTLIIDTKERKF